jgi:hypothetical protein
MFKRVLATFLVGAVALGGLSASAAAATRFVAPTGSDEAGNECLSSVEPCKTVGWGIEEAEAGDTVSIASGTYQEEFRINKELKMVGEGPSTILEGEPTVQRSVYVTADATLENLRIRGGVNGYEAKDPLYIGGAGTAVSLNEVVAEQAPGSTSGRNAVYVAIGSSLVMKKSTITGVGTTCLWVGGSATVIESNITVIPYRGGYAAHVSEGASVNFIGSALIGFGSGSALTSEGATVVASDSTFAGVRGISAFGGLVALTRTTIAASEVGLADQRGATVSMRDSLIAPSTGGKLGLALTVERNVVPPAVTIIGSTLYAEGSARYTGPRAIQVVGGEGGSAQVQVANSILRAVEAGAYALDLEGEAVWSINHSDFTTVSPFGPPQPGGGTNVAVVPLFAAPLIGDFRLTVADPALINAGDPAQVLPEETDLAGMLRTSNGGCTGKAAPALGAYEFFHLEPCPPLPSGGGGQVDHVAGPTPEGQRSVPPVKPEITGVKLRSGAKGQSLAFTLSEPAKVKLTVAKPVAPRAGKHGKTSYQVVATLTEQAKKGSNQIALSSRLRDRKLAPGSYRLTLIASAEGLTSTARTLPLIEKETAAPRGPR